ncbi:MAG: hypothetical protein C4532_18185 [Candidatus Abyssobacteria bacterium SURF_17]|uniref:Uncharacterized protein n=1 Tax=Candidatus Abyssobacteria bacterium SURF_17 TaxID=2093361 RepID=A0A419EPJ6_9BACT|nr:MAG: hypothetical protein C4532_18185 [Candidatus Abyssubacteria bacterium SURF_17]
MSRSSVMFSPNIQATKMKGISPTTSSYSGSWKSTSPASSTRSRGPTSWSRSTRNLSTKSRRNTRENMKRAFADIPTSTTSRYTLRRRILPLLHFPTDCRHASAECASASERSTRSISMLFHGWITRW